MQRAFVRTAIAVALGLFAAATSGCGRVEGRTSWQAAMHSQLAAPRTAPADAVFPVPPPPFSTGIFPCSRCHEGGAPAASTADQLPAMPHGLHVRSGLECADCHMAGGGDDPAIPAREVCDTCHGDPAKLSVAAAAYFARVSTSEGITQFPRRWVTPDVDPQHARHAKASVACAACHGEPADAPFTKTRSVPLMERCIACHEERAKPVKCDTCHKTKTQMQHVNIVLHHAEKDRGCLDCHDALDRDVLRLANGTKIPFGESFKLCGQCHGTQYRDWKIGLHGKRTGEWNGRREYRLCVSCHWPHEPRFASMAPSPPPARPEEVR